MGRLAELYERDLMIRGFTEARKGWVPYACPPTTGETASDRERVSWLAASLFRKKPEFGVDRGLPGM
jgi:hypothetical protein